MPFYILLSLSSQADRLADDLFELAVETMENPRLGDFNKICSTLEHALCRSARRKKLAGI